MGGGFKKQSLFAAFPISEDLMVGDVFLDTRRVSDFDKDAFKLTRISRADPDAILRAHCEDRVRRIMIGSANIEYVSAADKKEQVGDTTQVSTSKQSFFQCERYLNAEPGRRRAMVRKAVLNGALIAASGRLALREYYNRPMAVGAGARLEYPAEKAIIINGAKDVGDTLRTCTRILGEMDQLGEDRNTGDIASRVAAFQHNVELRGECPKDGGPVHTALGPIQLYVCDTLDRVMLRRRRN